jgi:uncharacterized protein (DUF342 family)
MAENDASRTPVPDPTKLTTDAVNAAVDISRREINALRELLCQRMDGMDAAEIERYKRMEERFARVEQMRIEQKNDVAAAVAAALAAQKEAIGKTELSTKEQITSLSATASTAYEAIRRDIDDLKARVTIVEAAKLGASEAKAGVSSQAGLAIAALGLVVAGFGVVVTVVLAANGVL